MTNTILPPNAVPFTNAYTVDVTPELAKSWLDANELDRPVSELDVQKYAAHMEAGLWQPLSHNGIAFTEDGMLLDGLHRLHAVIRCGKTVPMVVVINEPLENASVIDNRNNR